MSSTSALAFAQSNTFNEFKSEVLVNMQSRETAFTINYTGDATEFIKQANTLIKEASKSDEYLNFSWIKQSGSISGTQGNLNVSLTVSYLATKAQEDFVDQKIKALHDYVCGITSYDYTLQENSAYTALVDGKTICRGYAYYCTSYMIKQIFLRT